MVYPNPWLRIRSAIWVRSTRWYFTLEHSGMGTYTLGGFNDGFHCQFRALDDLELPRMHSVFLEWVNDLRLQYFTLHAPVLRIPSAETDTEEEQEQEQPQ
jgi:hypothetical protein